MKSNLNSGGSKVHHHLVDQLVLCLQDIFIDGKYADKAIERFFKANRKWGARDRRFFAESVYEIVRWWRKYRFLVRGEDCYQEKAHHYDLWEIWGVHWVLQGNQLPDWEELDRLNEQEIQQRNIELERRKSKDSLGIRESIPDWLVQFGIKQFGDNWAKILQAMNKPAEVYIRANLLRITPEELPQALAKDEILIDKVKDPELPLAFKLRQRKNVFTSQAFRDGFFEVQDAGSQYIAPLLDIQPGHRVVDACAGAGGKSLHLASLMKNKGKIVSLDIHEWKLKELKERARRNKVDIIETKVIDSNKVIKRLSETADRVLLDVPCSGLGVLKRNPDSKWKLTEDEVKRLINLQAEILGSYSEMTKKGGLLVYATCSLSSLENEEQVKKFLATHPQWELIKEINLRPDIQGYDGFYGALLKRN